MRRPDALLPHSRVARPRCAVAWPWLPQGGETTVTQQRDRATRVSDAVPGFSLAEAVTATLIIGLMFVAAMTAVGASRTSQLKTADRLRGQQLALDLMNEILQQAYMEPDDAPLFGREGAESSTSRALWDDVDDYAGWTESPPQNKNGTPVARQSDWAGWTRSVTVTWADPNDLTQGCATPTDLKRITVTVYHGAVPVATLVAVRSAAWNCPTPVPANPTGNRAPTAVASASPVSAPTNSPVSFSASGSADRDGDALTYTWKFGDGTTAAGAAATHPYVAPGTYTATLTASDGRGGKDVDSVTVTVLP